MASQQLKRHARHIARLVIDPVCDRLALAGPGLGTVAARALLIGTAVYESGLSALIQEGGPARSYWQIEPATARDVLDWSARRADLWSALCAFQWQEPKLLLDQYAANLHLACALARILYWRVAETLPALDDVEGLARYYKQHYNTRLGKGTALGWMRTYRDACAGIYDRHG